MLQSIHRSVRRSGPLLPTYLWRNASALSSTASPIGTKATEQQNPQIHVQSKIDQFLHAFSDGQIQQSIKSIDRSLKINSLQWAIDNIKKVSFVYTATNNFKKQTSQGEDYYTLDRLYSKKESSDAFLEDYLLTFMRGEDVTESKFKIRFILVPNVRADQPFSEKELQKGIADYNEKLCDTIHKLTGHRPTMVRDEKSNDWIIRWWT